MQENEFEKQVRQKMDAFQLQPAEAVWQQVQSQVIKRKESKRRYLIFFFLLLGFLAASLWVADLQQHTAFVNKQTKKEIEKNSPTMAENGLQQHQLTSTTNKVAGNKKEQTPFTGTNNVSNNKIRKATKGIIKATIAETDISENSTSAAEGISTQREPLTAAGIDVANEVKQDTENNALKGITAMEQLKNDSKKESAAIAKPVQPSTQNTKNKLLNTGFLFAIGRSFPVNSDPAKNGAAANYATGIGSGGTPTNSAGGSLDTYHYPSATQPGLSLVVGFEMSRFISAKTTMGLGLQYQLFTTSIATGQEINTQTTSDSRSVFLMGNSSQYTSYYHFIALPISLSTQIAAVKGRGILLNTGINFSRLLGTNALSFDNTEGKYYEDNTALNKTQVGLSASVLIDLAGKNKAPLYIGPDLYYGLTTQASSGMYAASHHRSFGITIKKMLTNNRSAAEKVE